MKRVAGANVSEYLEGRIFVAWLKSKHILFSHLPLNTYTSSWGAKARNKASGVAKGVPDFILVLDTLTLFVELKRAKGGRTSTEQKVWIEALNKAGCPSAVCKGANEAIAFVEKYL